MDPSTSLPSTARVLLIVSLVVVVGWLASADAQAQTPDATLDIAFAPGSPNPPVRDVAFSQALDVRNTGDVPLDTMVVIDTLPVEMAVSRVATGSYTGLTDFAAGEGVRVSYEKNTALGVFTLWGSSPNTTTNATLTAPPPGLGAGEYLTRVRWEYGQAAAGMQPATRPIVAGRIINPDNAGGPVAVGDTVQNCATLTAASITSRNACENFVLIAGPSIAVQAADSTPLGSPVDATAVLSGGDPTGSLTFQVYAASDAVCATALFEDDVDVDGAGSYVSPAFPASVAGAYKWVARYGGDSLHAAASTACNDPAGAFAVVAPPEAAAAFGATAIDVGASTSLTFTISNPAGNTVALDGTLPDGLVVASPNEASETCGGTITAPAGSRDISLAGGTIAAGASCAFSVDVQGEEPGLATATGMVSSANGGTGNTAAASLTVREQTSIAVQADSTPLGSPVDVTAVLGGGDPTGSLTFEVFAASDALCTTALFEGEVEVDGAGSYASPAFAATAAGAYKWVARYGGDDLHTPASTACDDPAGAFAVVAPPEVAAAFGATAIDAGASTALTFTISNPAENTVALSGVALDGTLPAGLVVASANGVSGTCGGTVTAPAGSRDISLAGGTIAVGASCAVSVDVRGEEPGPATTTSVVGSANGGTGNTATASLTVREPTHTTLSCHETVTVGDEGTCTVTVRAGVAPAGTVAFATDATGTFSAQECSLEPFSATDAGCEVRYKPSGDVPATGRHDRLTSDYTPADAEIWSTSATEATVTVRVRPAPPEPPAPPLNPIVPQTGQELALACSPAGVVLISAAQAGRRVRFRGAADPAAAGQRVTIRTVNGGRVVVAATVLQDGSFRASGPLPGRRTINKTRYYAQIGDRRSARLKLTRRMTARLTTSAGAVTVSGRVSPPLGKSIQRVVIRRLTGCASGYEVVARVRPDTRGRFRVSLPPVSGPALYRAQTSVPMKGGEGRLQTFALVLGADVVPRR